METDLDPFKPERTRDKENAKQAVLDFVEGAVSGDIDRMKASFDGLEIGANDGGEWVSAMRAASRLTLVPRATQEFFLQLCLDQGEHIRQECTDLVFLAGLRILLPKYDGPAIRLYRGESFHNRSRRTYGLSWTAGIEVAREFAQSRLHQTSNGGSVLLETLAPPDAIICAPFLLDNRYAENEYIVDRRCLASVKAIERFSQLSHDQFRCGS